MSRWHTWRRVGGSMRCVRCGQKFINAHGTARCVCWKLRLPRRKEAK